MGILHVLKTIGKGAQAVVPAVVPAINPAAGAITQLILNAVVHAEQSGVGGAVKKQQVMNEVVPIAGPLLTTILQTTGGKVKLDSQGINDAVSEIVEGIVKLLKAVDVPAAAVAVNPKP